MARALSCSGRASAAGKGSQVTEKLDEFVVYRSDDYYAGHSSVCKTARGELLVGFRRMPNRKKQQAKNLHIDADSHVALVRSADEGKSWSDAATVHRVAGIGQQTAELTTLSDGRILMGAFRWEVLDAAEEADIGGPHQFTRNYHRWDPNTPWKGVFKMTGGMVTHSDDDGETWAPWRAVVLPEPYLEGLCSIQGKCVELPGGRILLPAYATTAPGRGTCSVCLASDDRGESFTFLSSIADVPGRKGGMSLCEPSLYLTAGGDVVCLIRSTGDPHGAIWLSRSADGGATWQLERLNGVNGHPTKAIRLSDGRVLVVYGYRYLPGCGVRLRIVDPECRRIGEAEEIVVRDDGAPPDATDEPGYFDLGYPDAVEIEPGKVLIVYYWPDEVADCRIEASVLRV